MSGGTDNEKEYCGNCKGWHYHNWPCVTEKRDCKPIEEKPIPMFLTCPVCNHRHIDKGEYAEKPHHTHACQNCGLTWRPAIVCTVGVAFLPGFKDE